MTIQSQIPELDLGGFAPPYKIGSQNTPYKLGLESGLAYFRILTICLLLVYFVSTAGFHCFDLKYQHDRKIL